MPTILPIAYYTGATTPSGYEKYGNLLVGISDRDYGARPEGLQWWATPDLDTSYVICRVNPNGNQPNKPNVQPTYISYVKTKDLEPTSFVDLAERVTNQTFTSSIEAQEYILNNGMWTNFVPIGAQIYAYGFFTALGAQFVNGFRLLSNGSLDTTYNIGVTGFGGNIITAFELDNGSIVYGSTNLMTYKNIVYSTRALAVDTSGNVDTSFNIGTGFNGTILVTKRQPDGKLLLGGEFTQYNGVAVNRLIRISQDGSVDTSFVTALGTGFNSRVTGIGLFTNGSIAVSGDFTTFQGASLTRCAKLNADGSRDTSFSVGTGFNVQFRGIYPQPDNKIICAGSFSIFNNNGVNARGIARLNANGSLDNTFNSGNGFLGNPVTPQYSIETDDAIIMGGSNISQYNSVTSPTSLGIYKILKSNPSVLNSAFSANTLSNFVGAQLTTLSLSYDNTKILAAGFSRSPIVINVDGTLDSSFNINPGYATGVLNVFYNSSSNLYYTYNSASTTFGIQQLNNFGRMLDTGYQDEGFVINPSFNSTVFDMIESKDGKILICGAFTTYNNNSRAGVTKILRNGTVDSTFLSTGTSNFAGGTGSANECTRILEYPDGRLIFLGRYTGFNSANRNGITRTSANGVTDNTFISGNPGTNSAFGHTSGTVGNLTNRYPQRGSLTPDNKLVVVGSFTNWNLTGEQTSTNNYRYIMRFNENGSVDNTFTYPVIFNNSITDVIVQSDGKMVCIGAFTAFGTTTKNRILRLNVDGTLDETFNSGTGFTVAPTVIYKNKTDDGMFIIGSFTSYNGVTQNRILKLLADGTIDPSFTNTTGLSQVPNDIQVMNDGKIYIVSTSVSFNFNGGSNTSNGVLRLLPDGSYDPTWELSTRTTSQGPSVVYVYEPPV